ncbi:MAG: peptide MFS transporter [Bacteroidales bacterium]|jgi:POT family proton-dependent oligopeptide transporter|nr:peptide MFS transporter [Bacteroidales bacterium]
MSSKDTRFLGHPLTLSTLFMSEMWERFSYYCMRALLVLYLTAKVATGGFGMSNLDAYTIYGIFTALVYVTPIIGGILADKVFGQRKCIYIGGITMAIGQFMLAGASYIWSTKTALTGAELTQALDTYKLLFYTGLGTLIMGNGFFKPNISTMVGQLYDNSDPRKDSGFTLFYMGINIGAFLSPLVAGKLGEQIAWYYGFLAAGIGMLLGTTWFLFGSKSLKRIGMPPKSLAERISLAARDWFEIVGLVLGMVTLVILVLYGWDKMNAGIRNAVIYIAAAAGIAYLAYNIIKGAHGRDEWSRLGVIVILAVFNIFFWAGFEQAGSSFNMFAKDNTQRMLGTYEIPATWFQSVNAIFVVLMAPIMSVLWIKLSKIKRNPNTPLKFAISMFLLAAGFVVMAIAWDRSMGAAEIATVTDELGQTAETYTNVMFVSPLWLVVVFFLHTLGELCMSPIGLSMVTKLSPPKIVSMTMGLWMASFAAGNFVASQMTEISLWIADTWLGKYVINPTGVNVTSPFWMITIQSVIIGLLLLAMSPWLKKMMKGID